MLNIYCIKKFERARLNFVVRPDYTVLSNASQLLVFTNRTIYSNENDKIILIGETLIPSDQTRFLSVIIDINLDFKLHIMQILDKIS